MTPCYTKSWNRDFPYLVQTMYVYLSSLRPISSKSPDELCARDAIGLRQSPTLQALLRSSLSTTMKRANFLAHFLRILCQEEVAAISSLSPARNEGRDGDDILCNAGICTRPRPYASQSKFSLICWVSRSIQKVEAKLY